jgi:hypothetical protein
VPSGSDPPEPLEQQRRAHDRMPGQRQLRLGREDPQSLRPAEHEDRLGEPELRRDGLHLLVAQPVRVRQHRQRVARERHVGEDVEPVKRALAHGRR